jgi:hypothetical protein
VELCLTYIIALVETAPSGAAPPIHLNFQLDAGISTAGVSPFSKVKAVNAL